MPSRPFSPCLPGGPVSPLGPKRRQQSNRRQIDSFHTCIALIAVKSVSPGRSGRPGVALVTFDALIAAHSWLSDLSFVPLLPEVKQNNSWM